MWFYHADFVDMLEPENFCSVRRRDGFQHHPLVSGGLRATDGGAACRPRSRGFHCNRCWPEEQHRRPCVDRPRRRPERDLWSSLQAPRGFHCNRLPVARERVLYPRCDQHRGPLRGASMAAGLSVEVRAYATWPDVLGGPAGFFGSTERMTWRRWWLLAQRNGEEPSGPTNGKTGLLV